jgi:protein involved in polysaccharide export with SLBB domain
LTTVATLLPRFVWGLCVLVLACLAACGTYEDQRIRQLLHEKGFGTRADGDATVENYIGGGDLVQFMVPPDLLLAPGLERLGELTVPQPLALDGTIFVPFVGPVYVLGKTEAEAAALVKAELKAAGVKPALDIQARITLSRKVFYAVGETGQKGPIAMTPDLTFFDAMFLARWTNLANLGRVYLIRPDAEHPLTVDINFREMLTTGLTTANVALRERDIIYVPPTFLGLVARLLERLLQPLGLAVQSVLGLAQAQASYEVLTGERDYVYFRF